MEPALESAVRATREALYNRIVDKVRAQSAPGLAEELIFAQARSATSRIELAALETASERLAAAASDPERFLEPWSSPGKASGAAPHALRGVLDGLPRAAPVETSGLSMFRSLRAASEGNVAAPRYGGDVGGY
jgi:hypothetical protein